MKERNTSSVVRVREAESSMMFARGWAGELLSDA